MRRRFLGLPEIAAFEDIHNTTVNSGDYITDVANSLANEQGFNTLDLRELMCSGSTCNTLDKLTGTPVFIDNNHFSPDWIRRHGDVFSSYVVK